MNMDQTYFILVNGDAFVTSLNGNGYVIHHDNTTTILGTSYSRLKDRWAFFRTERLNWERIARPMLYEEIFNFRKFMEE